MKRKDFVVVLCSLVLVWGSNQIWAGDQSVNPLPSFFQKSLHATGEGMRYWYEEQGGFMAITKIPYAQLSCKNCHVTTCDQCHATTNENGRLTFSADKARKTETCLVCHSREKLSMKFAKVAGHVDVHFAAAMSCADCQDTMSMAMERSIRVCETQEQSRRSVTTVIKEILLPARYLIPRRGHIGCMVISSIALHAMSDGPWPAITAISATS